MYIRLKVLFIFRLTERGILKSLLSSQVKLNIFVGPGHLSNIPARKQTDVYFFSRTKALNEYR